MILAVYVVAFTVGTVTHVADVLRWGILPRNQYHSAVNLFWTSLTLFDPLAIVLLLRRQRSGILLGGLIMVLDVAVNLAAGLHEYFATGRFLMWGLSTQIPFFLFLLATAPSLWSAFGGDPPGNEMPRTRQAERRSSTSRLLVIVAIAGCLSCKEAMLEVTGGTSGHSFVFDHQFVILNNGFLRGDVTWVAVRSWPDASTPEERRADPRVALGPQGCCLIRRQDGRTGPPVSEPRLYFFDGDTLTTFPIRMKEDDFIGFHPEAFKSYSDVLHYFRQFEIKH